MYIHSYPEEDKMIDILETQRIKVRRSSWFHFYCIQIFFLLSCSYFPPVSFYWFPDWPQIVLQVYITSRPELGYAYRSYKVVISKRHGCVELKNLLKCVLFLEIADGRAVYLLWTIMLIFLWMWQGYGTRLASGTYKIYVHQFNPWFLCTTGVFRIRKPRDWTHGRYVVNGNCERNNTVAFIHGHWSGPEI